MVLTQTNNEDNTLMMGVVESKSIPVLGLDMWEHAYWEDHEGESTTSYVDKFLECVDWDKVSANFEQFNLKGQVAPII